MFNTKNLTEKLQPLSKRVVELSYEHKLGHIGSCLTSLPIICEMYENWSLEDDIFILSNGHAALALYVVLEEVYGHSAEKLVESFGVHPVRDPHRHIYCSTGSLGQGITVGIGYAVSNRNRFVNILLSDGECFEGSVWESLKFIYDQRLTNIRIFVNMNGYSAISNVDRQHLAACLSTMAPRINIIYTHTNKYYPILSGLEAHYKVLNEQEYNNLLEMI